MKRLAIALAVTLGWASVVWAVEPVPLTTLQAIHGLSNAEASHSLPVAFEATVTYAPGHEGLLFVQDGGFAVFVFDTANSTLIPGDRVLVRGTTQASFRPIVISKSVILLHHGVLPKPVPATFDKLIHKSRYDCMLVTVRAVVHTADLRIGTNRRLTYLQMLADGGYIDASVDSDDENARRGLLDAEVEVTGVAGGIFDGKMQPTGILLHLSSFANVKILKHASVNPLSLPVTPMGDILFGYHMQDQTQRVRVHGAITYYQPGSAVVLQDGAKSLWVTTLASNPMQIGDIADATGFPDTRKTALVLTHGEIQDSQKRVLIKPLPATWRQLAFWSANKPDGHLYDLVSIEGKVVTEVRGATQDEYVLISDGQLFSAIYRHPDPGSHIHLPQMTQIPLGSGVRVTGICMNEDTNTFGNDVELPFNILLRSFDDITVIARPSPLNIHNLMLIVGLLLVIVAIVGINGWALGRRMRRQTAAMSARAEAEAERERRRSRILEDINGSRPLAEILEEITEMVSIMLHGAPCWCEIADGTRLGNCPKNVALLRVLPAEIPARSGPALGTIFAAFNPKTPPVAAENEALSVGTRLATLAIETRGLYSDLLHRSEFDLLTDIYNRFSLEKQINMLIEETRRKAGVFGLIYIDLDKFKQVNDQYGHHIGDLYLQEVAERMKQQLRARDLLARLGGDEFAVLLPIVRDRAGVEEVVQRLGHCFDAPFNLGGHLLHGSISIGIALYPEDSATGEGLLNVADASMYVVKHSKRQAASRSLTV
jgi:diguanylate cyclase (GGDEF)-like protein